MLGGRCLMSSWWCGWRWGGGGRWQSEHTLDACWHQRWDWLITRAESAASGHKLDFAAADRTWSDERSSLRTQGKVVKPRGSWWRGWGQVSRSSYLGRQRPHPAGCRPQWCGSPWWRRLHPAAPRRCWRWRCCCSCSCSSLCGTAAPTPFSNAPVPWVVQEGGGRWWRYTHRVVKRLRYREATRWRGSVRCTEEEGGVLTCIETHRKTDGHTVRQDGLVIVIQWETQQVSRACVQTNNKKLSWKNHLLTRSFVLSNHYISVQL